MILKEQEGLSWLEFELLSTYPQVAHGVFSRKGGVSRPPFNSLNLAYTVGDDVDCVTENWRRVNNRFPQVARMIQVHGTRIVRVDRPGIAECDGLITNQKGLALVALHADCQGTILFDPIHEAIGVVHAGWRGQMAGIYSNCIEAMCREFGTQAKDLLVTISPSLGPSYAEFIHYEKEILEEFWHMKQGRHFNLWEIAKKQLVSCGVPPEQIQIAGICTYATPEDFFSYRRDKRRSANATIASLTDLSF